MRYHAVIHGQGGVPLSLARKIQTILVVAVLVFLAGYLAAGWYYSDEIQEAAFMVDHEEEPFDLRVTSIAGGRIALKTTAETESDDRWDKPGLWSMVSADTHNQVDKIVDSGEDSVVREVEAQGPLPQVGDAVRLDSYVYARGPFHRARDRVPGDRHPRHPRNFSRVAHARREGHLGNTRAREGGGPPGVPSDAAHVR